MQNEDMAPITVPSKKTAPKRESKPEPVSVSDDDDDFVDISTSSKRQVCESKKCLLYHMLTCIVYCIGICLSSKECN